MSELSRSGGEPRVSAGRPLPFGAAASDDGINFAVFSRHAERVELVIFAPGGEIGDPWCIVDLSDDCHRTGDVWHVRLSGLPAGITFGWRVHGPFQPEQGHRFDGDRLLLDPYALALAGSARWNAALTVAGRPTAEADSVRASELAIKPTCLTAHPMGFDWQGDCPLRRPWADTVIYETHVRGLTMDASAMSAHPGTFIGVMEKIPHFRKLGVTALELMPVQEFFEDAVTRHDPATGARLRNYWGYDTVAFFAPKESYGTRAYPGCQITEFKTMVRALHQAGIEVILDMVFNHTAEGDHTGPTLSFRGLDNSVYYLLAPDRRFYLNYSGCGNTMNCGHPVVRDYILDCLRYWVVDMHVDGFRFDLASVLGRDEHGQLESNPPLLERIAEDPILRHVKLVAEAWDAGGAYQVGSFPGQRWSEWNGRYRDDVRRYWRGDGGLAGAFASRLCGSADIYERPGKRPVHSINFVTSHDGFTLNDLVSYARKHNEANGEGNRDGSEMDFSANHGVEGPSDDPAVERLRQRQIRNFLATLLLSRGVPMLLGGDEFRRSQAGNNNAYCQDNDVSWYDWGLSERHGDLVDFTARLIAFRREHRVLSSPAFYTRTELVWFGPDGRYPDWNGGAAALGCGIFPADGSSALCLLFNPTPAPVRFLAPPRLTTLGWTVAIDTASEAGVPGPLPWSLHDRSLQVLTLLS